MDMSETSFAKSVGSDSNSFVHEQSHEGLLFEADTSQHEELLEFDIADILRDDSNINATFEREKSPLKMVPAVAMELIPTVGMMFETYEEIYTFYNTYARLGGYSVRKFQVRRDRGRPVWAIFVCNKQGQKEAKNFIKKEKVATRCNCLARIITSLCPKNKKWIVKVFDPIHNHLLHSPSKVNMHQSTRGLASPNKQLMIDKFSRVRLKASDMVKLLSNESGIQSAPFTKQEVYSYIRKTRKSYVGIDWQSALEYFDTKKLEDPNFYCAIQIDEDKQVCNCFWIDGKAREDYYYFGDVISFDTTYKKNQYLMPFAAFVGVNHHYQSIIMGCALLGDETSHSFTWLFKEWLKAISGRHPKIIFTDQDLAMKVAIEEVFSNSVHRCCIWHITQKFPKHLSGLYIQYPNDFKGAWNEWFYHSESKEEFEERWYKMLALYPKLNEVKWANDLWLHRKSWAFHYAPDVFTGGMTTTQRSESINRMFSLWFNSKTPVNIFVQIFDDVLNTNRHKEKQYDFNMKKGIKSCAYEIPLISHMRDIFTPRLFDKFQYEFGKTAVCHANLLDVDGDFLHYNVIHIQVDGRKKEYALTFQESKEELSACRCRLWTSTGIVCAHMFAVFKAKFVQRLPEKYILRRWTKAAKDDSLYHNKEMDFNMTRAMMTQMLFLKTQKYIKVALTCKESYQEALDELNRMTSNLTEKYANFGSNVIEGSPDRVSPDRVASGIMIKDRPKVHAKGGGKRIKSNISDKVTRNCQICHKAGHDARTCLDNPNKRQKLVEDFGKIPVRKCHSCGGVGHDRRNCDQFKGSKC